jgi:hypothetical protein
MDIEVTISSFVNRASYRQTLAKKKFPCLCLFIMQINLWNPDMARYLFVYPVKQTTDVLTQEQVFVGNHFASSTVYDH